MLAAAPAATRHAAPLGYADGQLEALKWLAMASMFTDHIGRHLLGWPQDSWVFALGRLAFPLFAFVLGVNLAREGDRVRRSGRTAARLLAWGVVSVLPSIWMRGEPQMLNVLFTLGLGAALCWLVELDAPVLLRALGSVAIAAAAWWVEFGIGGVFLVVAVYLACTRGEPGVTLVAALLAVSVAALNGEFGGLPGFAATLATLPLAAAFRALPVWMPRWQLLFYAIYPLHMAAIGALKSMH